MDSKILEENHEDLIKDRGFCRKIAIFFALISVFLALTLMLKNQVIVVNPPEMMGAYKISKDKADEAYKKAWALSMAKLIGNMSKQEAPYIIKQLSEILTPNIYNDARKALYAHIEMLQSKKITTTFTIKEIYMETKTQKIFVFGDMTLDSLISKKRDKIPFTFEFKVQISNFEPAINHLNFYQGKPRAAGINFDRNVKKEGGGEGA